MDASFSSRAWPLATAAIDHICARLGVRRPEACMKLKEALHEGTVKARGPINGANASVLESEFWRFAAIEPGGSAFNLSSLKKLSWFELNADDVLRVWPLAPPKRHPGGAPQAADWPAIEEALSREIESVGFPDRNAEPGWRTQADVIRWVEERTGNAEPGRTALKDNVSKMLRRIRDGRKVVSG